MGRIFSTTWGYLCSQVHAAGFHERIDLPLLPGENQIDAAAHISEFLGRLLALGFGSGATDLAHGLAERVHEFSQSGAVLGRQRVGPLGLMLLDMEPARFRQGDLFAATAGVDVDEALVLELVERRVDGARAG